MKKKGISALDNDENMKLATAASDGLKYFSPGDKPLRLGGLYWFDKEKIYKRFPSDVTKYPPNYEEYGPVSMSWHTSGAQLAFRSDSTKFVIKAKYPGCSTMDHMPQTGSAGFDLYLSDITGRMRFAGVTRFALGSTQINAEVIGKLQPEMRDVIINFPLYSRIEEMQIGVDEHCRVEKPKPWSDPRQLVFYGTSITQGGCATRPGMSYTSIIGRKLNMPVYNFGFSGCGRGEVEVARMLAEFDNPALFVLDYEINTRVPENYRATLPPFVDALRDKHPKTPILIVSAIRLGIDSLEYEAMDRLVNKHENVNISIAEVARRREAGDRNIHFFDGRTLLGEDWNECTVEHGHPTDLGFYRMAHNLLPTINELVNYQGGEK